MKDEERGFEPSHDETPEQVFIKQWAIAVLANARRGLEEWCNRKNRPDWNAIFQSAYFPEPGVARVTQHELAERFHMTRDQIRYALQQADDQFVECLRVELADQADSDEGVEAELKELVRLIDE